MPNILFVCSANKQRSATAADYFSEKYPQLEIKSAGTNHKTCSKLDTVPLTEEHLKWADRFFVMEERHLRIIEDHVGSTYFGKIIVLDLPDRFTYYQKELLVILEEHVDKQLRQHL
jgi:predicted protein tyrosine phosphatase